MNVLRWLSVSVFALSLLPHVASADEPTLAAKMQQHLETGFLKPLLAHDQSTSRFSRMRPPPLERRVRMPQPTPSVDASKRAFLPFAIDGKYSGGDWEENQITGCVYPDKGDMFVKIGDGYRPASFLLGASAYPVTGVCEPGK